MERERPGRALAWRENAPGDVAAHVNGRHTGALVLFEDEGLWVACGFPNVLNGMSRRSLGKLKAVVERFYRFVRVER